MAFMELILLGNQDIYLSGDPAEFKHTFGPLDSMVVDIKMQKFILNSNKLECIICHTEGCERKCPDCVAVYHTNCIDDWFRSSGKRCCAYCRNHWSGYTINYSTHG